MPLGAESSGAEGFSGFRSVHVPLHDGLLTLEFVGNVLERGTGVCADRGDGR